MTALERITHILERARIDGGWDDEAVAARVLAALGLSTDGRAEMTHAEMGDTYVEDDGRDVDNERD